MAFVVRHSGSLFRGAQVVHTALKAPSRIAGYYLPANHHSARRFMATASPPKPSETKRAPNTTLIPSDDAMRLLWDSECPLCVKEVNFLKRRCEKFERSPIIFVDIALDNYDPRENGDIDYETAMGKIHAVCADGKILVGIDAFAETYERIGLGWVYAATKLPVIGTIADWAYDFWADRRLTWTGRPSLAEIVSAREKRTCR